MRRDKIGRLIGYNWWRADIMSSWSSAYQAWWIAREAVVGCSGGEKDYDRSNPTPTLKSFMIGMAFKHLNKE